MQTWPSPRLLSGHTMMSNSRHVLLMTALASYSVLVFVLDVVTPRGIEVWVLNLPVVIAPVLFRNPRLVVFFGLASAAMVVVGWLWSPPGYNPPSWDILNRGMGLAAIGLIAAMAINFIKKTTQLDDALGRLRRETSERDRISRALERSEQRLRLAMEGAGMGTFDVNLQTGKVVWSATHLRMLGYRRMPGLGRACRPCHGHTALPHRPGGGQQRPAPRTASAHSLDLAHRAGRAAAVYHG